LYNCIEEDATVQQLNVQVLSCEFEQYISEIASNDGYVSYGLKEWYGFWCNPQPDVTEHILLTKRINSIRPTDGDVSIHIVCDTLSFLREHMVDGMLLTTMNCPKEAQECLFGSALKGRSVDAAIHSALNSFEFKPLDVMGKWQSLTAGQKQLIFLWYAIHPDNSYLCHCVGLSKQTDELPNRILMSFFDTRLTYPVWNEEAKALIAAVPIAKTDDYYAAVESIPSLGERLSFLTGNTARERVAILHIIGQWLRIDAEEALESENLQKMYPMLAAYLGNDYADESLSTYFSKYKMYKLSNTLPQDEESHFSVIETDTFDFRYPVLCEEATDHTCVLWIDALGAEWIPLLKWALSDIPDGKVSSVRVVQAQLPTETHYNNQWQQMNLPYEKLDKLDKLAHKGVIDDKDYYACVEEQINFVCGIANKACQLLKQYSRVIITGDHGTSRLAARFFHKLGGMAVIPNAEVGSHGRYCRVVDGAVFPTPTQNVVKDSSGNGKFIVFNNYDHYSKSGFAAGSDDDIAIYGEIHGGASPEEMLVPVISLVSNHDFPITANWIMVGNSIKITNKRAVCRIQFSKPVKSVQAKAGDIVAECSAGSLPSKEWTITLNGVKIDKATSFAISVLADGTLVNVDPVLLKPALGGGDPF